MNENLDKDFVLGRDVTDQMSGKSVYFLDPDGNELEIFAEGFEDPKDALDFIKQGTNRQAPLELEGAAAG